VDLYTTHADTIESALAHTCRAHRLTPDAADEFASWARLRLFDNDQAILRKFEGRSKLRTFLITVVQRLYLDWRNAEWGKWRPSAEARRLGSVAIELERLVLRDQHTYDEAVQTLAAREMATPAECEHVWVQLPRRPRRKRVDEEDMTNVPATSSASESVDGEEALVEAEAAIGALSRAIKGLPPSDQVLVHLHFWSGKTVARIAEITGDDQKALYRRFDKIRAELRRRLEAEGLTKRSLAGIVGKFDFVPPIDDGTGGNGGAAPSPVGIVTMRPSTERSTGGKHV
jgi:RNA polymerase sigma factor (sigma-70 family)